MAIVKKIDKTNRREIRDHLENTAKDLVKCYTLSQLSLMDWIDTRTVKTSGRYIPVRIDTWRTISDFRAWITKKPYSVMYIRLDEIKYIFSKRNRGKKLIID